MINQQIKSFLDKNQVNYQTIHHTPAYTSSQTAQAAHISGKSMAKVVMVKMDGEMAMVALPSNVRLNLEELKRFANCQNIQLAYEHEFKDKFAGCEVGAMPPIGTLYNMDVYVGNSLSKSDNIAFNGGNHTDLLQMTSKDFLNLVHPKLLPWG